MPFRGSTAEKALVACARRCCICRRFCGKKIELHHIVPESKGGDDSFENCIPLCLFCHEEVGSYNPAHPKGRKFSASELKAHRDLWYQFVETHPHRLSDSSEVFFQSEESTIDAKIEPFFRTANCWSKEMGTHEARVPCAKVRNQGTRTIFVDEIGFLHPGGRVPVTFIEFGMKDRNLSLELPAGHSRSYDLIKLKLVPEELENISGLYLVTGTGHQFSNESDDIAELIGSIRSGDSSVSRMI